MKNALARRASAAFTLVEVALALGIAAFCLVTVVALLPIGIDSDRTASNQTAASSILTHVLADLRATPMTSPPGRATKSTEYKVSIPAQPPNPTLQSYYFFGDSADQFVSPPITGTAPTAPFPAPATFHFPASADSRYLLTIRFLAPAGSRTATQVALRVSWPATVNPDNPPNGGSVGSVQAFAALDRN